MRILIIGGGIFLGRALIEAARSEGHEVTAFSRGQHALPAVDRVVTGNRNHSADLKKLARLGSWDSVIDTCAYWPDQVRNLIGILGSTISHFTLISSISAYADLSLPGITETADLAAPLWETAEPVTPANYGPLKAACEIEAQKFSGSFIIRPGIIAGPHDPTDRLAFWLAQITSGKTLVLPRDFLSAPVQMIDVRDLATWILQKVADGQQGTFNTVGSNQPLTGGEMLQSIAEIIGQSLKLQPVDTEELAALGFELKRDFPFFAPRDSPFAGMFQIDGRKALSNGLVLRSFSATAHDTATWFAAHRSNDPKLGWTIKTR